MVKGDELMSGRRCAQMRASGDRCHGFAVAGSTFCFAHDPAQAEKRDDARRRGGQAGRVATLDDSSIPVRTLHDVLGLMETTINDVRAGRVDVRVANAVGYLANVAMKALEQADLEARLEALEAVLEPERAERAVRRRAA